MRATQYRLQARYLRKTHLVRKTEVRSLPRLNGTELLVGRALGRLLWETLISKHEWKHHEFRSVFDLHNGFSVRNYVQWYLSPAKIASMLNLTTYGEFTDTPKIVSSHSQAYEFLSKYFKQRFNEANRYILVVE